MMLHLVERQGRFGEEAAAERVVREVPPALTDGRLRRAVGDQLVGAARQARFLHELAGTPARLHNRRPTPAPRRYRGSRPARYLSRRPEPAANPCRRRRPNPRPPSAHLGRERPARPRESEGLPRRPRTSPEHSRLVSDAWHAERQFRTDERAAFSVPETGMGLRPALAGSGLPSRNHGPVIRRHMPPMGLGHRVHCTARRTFPTIGDSLGRSSAETEIALGAGWEHAASTNAVQRHTTALNGCQPNRPTCSASHSPRSEACSVLVHTEEVTGSIPVSPTSIYAGQTPVTTTVVTGVSRCVPYVGSKWGAQDHFAAPIWSVARRACGPARFPPAYLAVMPPRPAGRPCSSGDG
jgi:hypothetical protein